MSSYFAHSLSSAAADFHHGSDYPSAAAVQGYSHQAPHYPTNSTPVNYSYNYGTQLDGSFYHMDRTPSMEPTVPLTHPQSSPVSGVTATTTSAYNRCPNQHQTGAAGVAAVSCVKMTSQTLSGDCVKSAMKGAQTARQPEQIYPWMRRIHSNTAGEYMTYWYLIPRIRQLSKLCYDIVSHLRQLIVILFFILYDSSSFSVISPRYISI